MRQGDIVINCPIFLSLKGVSGLGTTDKTTERGIRVWIGGDMGGTLPASIQGGAESNLVVPGMLNTAILLTRGCDVEQGDIRQVAPIFPLSRIQGDAAQAAVIDGRATSLHYLPAERINDWVNIEDSYVDYRYVSTLHSSLFDRLQRIVGLTQSAVGELMLSWVRHATGQDLVEEVECQTCGSAVPIFDQVMAGVTPTPDSF